MISCAEDDIAEGDALWDRESDAAALAVDCAGEACEITLLIDAAIVGDEGALDPDERGRCMELCSIHDMALVVLDQD